MDTNFLASIVRLRQVHWRKLWHPGQRWVSWNKRRFNSHAKHCWSRWIGLAWVDWSSRLVGRRCCHISAWIDQRIAWGRFSSVKRWHWQSKRLRRWSHWSRSRLAIVSAKLWTTWLLLEWASENWIFVVSAIIACHGWLLSKLRSSRLSVISVLTLTLSLCITTNNVAGRSSQTVLSEHLELLLNLRPLIAQISGLLLHHEQIVVKLTIQIVVLLPDLSHFLLKCVHKADQFRELCVVIWLSRRIL